MWICPIVAEPFLLSPVVVVVVVVVVALAVVVVVVVALGVAVVVVLLVALVVVVVVALAVVVVVVVLVLVYVVALVVAVVAVVVVVVVVLVHDSFLHPRSLLLFLHWLASVMIWGLIGTNLRIHLSYNYWYFRKNFLLQTAVYHRFSKLLDYSKQY